MNHIKNLGFFLFLINYTYGNFDTSDWVFVKDFGSATNCIGMHLDNEHQKLAQEEKKLKDLLPEGDMRNFVLAKISFVYEEDGKIGVESFPIDENGRPVLFESNNNGSIFDERQRSKLIVAGQRGEFSSSLDGYIAGIIDHYTILTEPFPVIGHTLNILRMAESHELSQESQESKDLLQARVRTSGLAHFKEKLEEKLKKGEGQIQELETSIIRILEQIGAMRHGIIKALASLNGPLAEIPVPQEIEKFDQVEDCLKKLPRKFTSFFHEYNQDTLIKKFSHSEQKLLHYLNCVAGGPSHFERLVGSIRQRFDFKEKPILSVSLNIHSTLSPCLNCSQALLIGAFGEGGFETCVKTLLNMEDKDFFITVSFREWHQKPESSLVFNDEFDFQHPIRQMKARFSNFRLFVKKIDSSKTMVTASSPPTSAETLGLYSGGAGPSSSGTVGSKSDEDEAR